MNVTIKRYPTDEDWARAYWLAVGTEGKTTEKVPDSKWREKLLRSGHSPARTLMYTIVLEDVPYWISVHLVRHKIGVEHYVQSQRNDRQSDYDRNAARQDMPVRHVIEANAQALIQISHMRLCSKAAKETRETWERVCSELIKVTPELIDLLVPNCVHQGGRCDEFKPCGWGRKEYDQSC